MKSRVVPVLLALVACHAETEAPPPAPALPPGPLPASALAGAVRALETLDAVRPEGTITQVRALECDRLTDPAGHGEFERVFLYLTVYAATLEQAQTAFGEVRAALEVEARAAGRAEPASAERVRRALVDLDWDPAGREDLVSLSDTVRLEITPGEPAEELDVHSIADDEPQPHATILAYVHDVAQREHVADVQLSPSHHNRRANELVLSIRPSDASSRQTRAEIGAFLAGLEGGSPAVRLTRLKIERSEFEPDVHAQRGWTFEAELTVHGAVARTASAAEHPSRTGG